MMRQSLGLLALFVLLVAALVAPASTLAQEMDEVDEVEQIEQVEAVVEADGRKPDTLLGLVGKLHPLAVHLPIGWLLLLLLIDLGAFPLRRPGWDKVGLPLLGGLMLVFIPAVATGLIRFATHAEGGTDQPLAELHRNLMLGALGCCLAALALRWLRRTRFEGGARWVYLLLILAAAGLMTIGGHLGGKLVFGEQYLPF